MRVRGLKSVNAVRFCQDAAPYTGAWIEMEESVGASAKSYIALHTGMWIEILKLTKKYGVHLPYPIRVRGLKYLRTSMENSAVCRAPYGCVD